MPDPYFWMVVAGGILLLIEAYRQFATRVTVETHGSYEILAGSDLESLCAKGVYLRGYLFYSAIYLAIYGLLLTSWVLGDAAIGAPPTTSEAGAQGDLPFELPNILDREGYGRPIYIAAACVSLLGLGWVSRVEQTLRHWAHRLAGIPHGIYRIISRMDQFDFPSVADQADLPFLSSFDRRMNAPRSDEQRHLASEIRDGLLVIDLVEPAVGRFRTNYWPQEALKPLDPLITLERQKLEALRMSLEDSDIDLTALRETVGQEKGNVQALFAVLYTKNRERSASGPHRPTNAIIQHLGRPRNDHVMHAIMGAAVFTFFLSFAAAYLIALGVKIAETDLTFWIAAKDDFVLLNTFIFVTAFVVALTVAAGLAAIARRNAKDVGRWPHYTVWTIPFSTMLRASLSPALLGTLTFVLVSIMAEEVAAYLTKGQLLTRPQLVGYIRTLPVPAMVILLAACCTSFCVYLVADLHNRFSLRQSAVTAALCAIPLLVVALLAYPAIRETALQGIRDGLNHITAALVFFAAFAVILEWSEED